MPNDFLSNLSSRALQNPEVDAAGSGLKPRLASRFESMTVPAVDQAPGLQSLSEVEVNIDTGFRNSAAVTDQSLAGSKHPASNEALWSGILTIQDHGHEPPRHFLENQGKPAVPNALKPAPAPERSEAFSQTRTPAHAEQTQFPGPARKDANPSQPNIVASSPAVSPRAEAQKTIESHTTSIEVQPPLTEQKKAVPASVLPVALPLSPTKVVPERIEVTHIERQPQSPPKGSQIVPSLELPAAFKSQSRMLETQEQPPTIHVTIGRIEVKAAPPTAAPKRRTASSSTMSLDEYLRRRRGSER